MPADEKTSSKSVPGVWVLVLHWNGWRLTQNCLSSILCLDYPNFNVLLVDNGSQDLDESMLRSMFPRNGAPRIEYLRLPDNRGFAGGCNEGIKHCLNLGASWIWLLNNDTRVAPESLSLLVQEGMKNESAGMLGAAVYADGNTQDVTSGPGRIDFLRAKTYLRPAAGCGNKPIKCQWLSGSNLLMRAEALRGAGMFDPAYFLYFEDTELCLRFNKAGWSCLFVPAARVDHAGNASTTGDRAYWRAYYYTRNRLLFFGTACDAVHVVPALLNIAAHLIRHALVLPFRGETGRKQWRAECLGLRDYLLGRFEKAECLDWCEER